MYKNKIMLRLVLPALFCFFTPAIVRSQSYARISNLTTDELRQILDITYWRMPTPDGMTLQFRFDKKN
jgi:hypothetical protein